MFQLKHEKEANGIITNLKKRFELTGGNPIANFLKVGLRRDIS